MSQPALFTPLHLGTLPLQHRVVYAPCNRRRATAARVPTQALMATYYAQRARTPGTLLIAEATIVHPSAGGKPHTPGIYSDAQVAGWKLVRTPYMLLVL